MLSVLKLEEPDRVPTFEWKVQIAHKMTSDGSYETFIDQYDIDAVTSYPDYCMEPVGSASFSDEWGATRSKPHALDDLAPKKKMSDVQNYTPLDPYAPRRLIDFAQ